MHKVGSQNKNGQVLLGRDPGHQPNHPKAEAYKMECSNCGHVYGCNGCDWHIRRCPVCQAGAPGLPDVQ